VKSRGKRLKIDRGFGWIHLSRPTLENLLLQQASKQAGNLWWRSCGRSGARADDGWSLPSPLAGAAEQLEEIDNDVL
jgi:hypothetical protein